MPFSVTLPNPVPSTGVQFVGHAHHRRSSWATFTATGGPIEFAVNGSTSNVTEFGDNFGLFCTSFPNDTEPTGLTTTAPAGPPIEPVIATGQATITPPPPIGPGGADPTSCTARGRRWATSSLNDVTTTAHAVAGRPFSRSAVQRDRLPEA